MSGQRCGPGGCPACHDLFSPEIKLGDIVLPRWFGGEWEVPSRVVRVSPGEGYSVQPLSGKFKDTRGWFPNTHVELIAGAMQEAPAEEYDQFKKVDGVTYRYDYGTGEWVEYCRDPLPGANLAFFTEEADAETKPTNPKDAIGSDKLPLHLWPASATAFGALGLLDGMLKYGRSNWREAGVRVTIYLDALERHAKAYGEGEDLDPDSGLPHLSHMLACLAILVDAGCTDGKLVDDRNFNGSGYRTAVDDMTPHVARLKAKHADRSPKHYTIEDGRSS